MPSGARDLSRDAARPRRTVARVTAFVQNGSLPVYAGVILLTAAVASRRRAARGWRLAGLAAARQPCARRRSPSSLVVAAFGAAIVRRRFSAAVFLGVAGYAMAGLFVLSGAPDLALTQVAVETLSTVVFVLVLRRLPERFERQSTPRRRTVRLAHRRRRSAVTVFVFALVAAGVRPDAARCRRRWSPGPCPTATDATS